MLARRRLCRRRIPAIIPDRNVLLCLGRVRPRAAGGGDGMGMASLPLGRSPSGLALKCTSSLPRQPALTNRQDRD